MTTREIFITQECYFTCMTHALASAGQEIMGFLLGDIELPVRFSLLLD